MIAWAVCTDGSQVYLLDGLATELLQEFPDESVALVDHVLVQAFEAASTRERFAHDLTCLRDYSNLCPQGWSEMEDGQTCSAPLGYQGVCAQEMIFSNLDPAGKIERASECGAQYACIGRTPENFSMPCP